MKPPHALVLLLPAVFGAACFAQVQSLSSVPGAADGSVADPDGGTPGAVGCGPDMSGFFKLTVGQICPNISSTALVFYDVRGNPVGRPNCAVETKIDGVLAIGSRFALATSSSNTSTRSCPVVLTPLPGTVSNDICVASRNNASGLGAEVKVAVHGDSAYVAVFAGGVNTLYTANLETGATLGYPLSYEFAGDYPRPDRMWTDEGTPAATTAVYMSYGSTIWRVNAGESVARRIYTDVQVSRSYAAYIRPGTTEVFALIGGQTGLRWRNNFGSPPFDEALVTFPDGDVMQAYGSMVFDRLRSQFVLASTHTIVDVPVVGGTPRERYRSQWSATEGRISMALAGGIFQSAAGTEMFFPEQCAPASATKGNDGGFGPASPGQPQFGTRAMNFATGKVEWLWERVGYPLVEGNRALPNNGTYTARVVPVTF